MHHPTDRIAHTTAFVITVVEHWLEWEIAQWVHPMKDRSDDPPHHERMLYLWATSRSTWQDDSNGAVANKLHSVKLLQAVQEDWNCFVVPASVIQLIAWPPLKRSVVGSILFSGPSCSLGYFPFQSVVHNWFIKGRGMYCSVYGKVHIKDPLLLIEKSSLCGSSGIPSKKCVNVTIWMTSNNRW